MKNKKHLLLLATRNPKKNKELRKLLPKDFKTISLISEFPKLPIFKENGRSFLSNAKKKAKFYSRLKNLPILAEDSGLQIDALGGAPGIHSSRFLGVNTSYPDRFEYILNKMKKVPFNKRTARFRCVIAISTPEKFQKLFISEGICEGHIAFEPRGNNGFGYDPLFIPKGYKKTFAELGSRIKNKISHRKKAVDGIKKFLNCWMSIPEKRIESMFD